MNLNELTKEEKLEIFEKFYKPNFYNEYKNIPKIPWAIGLSASSFLIAFGILTGLFVHPVLLLLIFPSLIIPFMSYAYTEAIQKEAIQTLTRKISFKDFVKLYKSKEWQELAELHKQKIEKEIKEIAPPINYENIARSLNVCVIKDEKTENKKNCLIKKMIKTQNKTNLEVNEELTQEI